MEVRSLTAQTQQKGGWTRHPCSASLRKVTLACYSVMQSAVPMLPPLILTKTLWVGHPSNFRGENAGRLGGDNVLT